jgi:hypothetical protein
MHGLARAKHRLGGIEMARSFPSCGWRTGCSDVSTSRTGVIDSSSRTGVVDDERYRQRTDQTDA